MVTDNVYKWNYFVFKSSFGSYEREIAVLAPNEEIAKCSLGFTDDEKVVLTKEISGALVYMNKSKLKSKEIIGLYQNLQKCMKSGASVSKALQIAAASAKHPLTRGVIGVLVFNTSKNGLQLSAAMEKLKCIFDTVTIAMIKAGEHSGELPFILEDLAKQMEQSAIIKAKTLAGLAYPMFVIGITFIGVIVINFFVFPSIIRNFKMINAKLPKVTEIMIEFIQITSNHPTLLGLPILLIGFVFFYRKKITNADWFQRCLLKIPIVGPVIAGFILERSLHALSLLQKSGINVIDTYKMTIEVAGNIVFREYFLAILGHIKAGNTADKAFLKERYRLGNYSIELANLMRVASFTGEDWKALTELAYLLGEEVKIKADALPKLIQPILLLFIALIVGFMIAAIYLPSFYLLLNAFKN